MIGTTQPDIQIIIPSAGGSTRLHGNPKQDIQIKGRKLWQQTVDLCLPLAFPISLVTGHWRPTMPLPAGVNELHFPQWKTGMGASIAFGVKQSPIPKLGYLIVLIDQWGLSTKLLQDFVSQWDARSAQISVEAEYSGPPVLFPSAMHERLIKLSGEKGAKKLIQSAHPRRITVSGASWDLDTETDLFLMQQLTQTDNNKDEPYDFT